MRCLIYSISNSIVDRNAQLVQENLELQKKVYKTVRNFCLIMYNLPKIVQTQLVKMIKNLRTEVMYREEKGN